MKKFLSQIFTWWNGQTLGTRWFTARKGELVGSDDFGNLYYKERRGKRRWVIYKGYAEPSQIPPGWHGWIHHRVDTPPEGTSERPHSWVEPHQENLTGTADAYRPQGSILTTGKRAKATGDYDAWSP